MYSQRFPAHFQCLAQIWLSLLRITSTHSYAMDPEESKYIYKTIPRMIQWWHKQENLLDSMYLSRSFRFVPNAILLSQFWLHFATLWMCFLLLVFWIDLWLNRSKITTSCCLAASWLAFFFLQKQSKKYDFCAWQPWHTIPMNFQKINEIRVPTKTLLGCLSRWLEGTYVTEG